MSALTYYIICAVLSIMVLIGISKMSKVETATNGNRLSALSLFLGVILTLVYYDIFDVGFIYICILIGSIIGYFFAKRIKMIQMPQLVALLNGIGGAASAFVGILSYVRIGSTPSEYENFTSVTAVLAIVVGLVTLVGSLVAAGKLHKVLPQKPIVWKNHQLLTTIFIIGSIVPVVGASLSQDSSFFFANPSFVLLLSIASSCLFGLTFAIRVGGADMPITISLLNSLSGVAGAIAGMAIGDILLVSVGGIVGASGLLLTQIMCRNMNRHLIDILLGKTSAAGKPKAASSSKATVQSAPQKTEKKEETLSDIVSNAKEVILIPGYGMALAQAQHQVKQLADKLEKNGAKVRFAVHPVAGRMPGHMNVLLAEADVPYDELYEMEQINDDFKDTDLTIIIGANDVVNPAAREAEGTPIYGMPVLNADQAKNVIVCNYDTKPGYAGVENPLYSSDKAELLLGDAKESLNKLIDAIQKPGSGKQESDQKGDDLDFVLSTAKSVILVPGYGMALAQAQHQVKQLADKLERNGAKVRFAVHPVAGRMPGHMNVLLAEADVPYDELYEMEQINDDFKETDLAIVIGANDVINPAAREAEGTPIYGMPVLNVDEAKQVIICNYDTKPGYAGVDNPLYNSNKARMLLGDAKESLNKLLEAVKKPEELSASEPCQEEGNDLSQVVNEAKQIILIPGYGMALAQAQHQVKQLADKFEQNGAKVRFAVHPVAGRMPGHMNVLLAEADVPYDELYEMEQINDDFKDTDLVIIIGANDVVNPAAREAEGTPIYGMPVLNADQAKHVIVCNFDTKPGYAGVENPLYESDKTTLLLGDAKESVHQILDAIGKKSVATSQPKEEGIDFKAVLKNAKEVILVPGYGMALAQAQHQVKQLADKLERNGARVRFAVHPVAGRMPGHMNVLLAEADVPYDELYEMEQINDDFAKADLAIVVGANDVVNPAAREAEGTPIYGMPVLNVDQAKNIIVCNFDTKPGYAGVDNPLYESPKAKLMLGDAKESLLQLLDTI